jgi:putative membrane protein
MMGSMMGGMALWSVLGMLLLVALLAVGVAAGVGLVRGGASRKPLPAGVPERDEAKEILRRRYAAGEIDEDDYLRRMSGLAAD